MTRFVLTTAFALTGVAMMLGTSWGARLYISDSPSSPTAGVNPTFTLPGVGASLSLYIWAELADDETIPGLAYDVVNTTPGIASATPGGHVVDNPVILGPRWSATNLGVLGELVSGSNFVNVGGGLNGAAAALDPLYDASTSSYRVSKIDFIGDSIGSTEVFLGVGSAGIASGDAGAPIFLGWGDVSIANNAFGTTSSLADATIVVVPEPSCFGFACLGLIALPLFTLKRRRTDAS